MAPVDPTTTKRIRAHYTGPFGSHTMLFHATTGLSDADFLGDVQDVVELLANIQYDGTVWDTAESAAAGSALFFPLATWTPITSGSAIGTTGHIGASTFIQFGGRTLTSGVRTKLYLFETYLPASDNMKYTPGENAGVDAVITELQSADSNLGAIDGDIVGWYSYANGGQNDFITHRARRS